MTLANLHRGWKRTAGRGSASGLDRVEWTVAGAQYLDEEAIVMSVRDGEAMVPPLRPCLPIVNIEGPNAEALGLLWCLMLPRWRPLYGRKKEE